MMKPNPYEPPGALSAKPGDIVDRARRNELAALVRRFLNEKDSAFEFDGQVAKFGDSPDSAIRFVVHAVWFHYDGCADHLVDLSKPEWDYFQRLLLLLESNHSVRSASTCRWSFLQLFAAVALIEYVAIAHQVGWRLQLILSGIPFGIVSICLAYLRYHRVGVGPYDTILFPFTSFDELRAAYDSARFKKMRYPFRQKARRVRPAFVDILLHIQFYVLWSIFAPIVLFFQLFPVVDSDRCVTNVSLPNNQEPGAVPTRPS
jgi:hypothetical protein